MTDLSSSFLSVEEPELDSIDFRQSLRFFQDQLILNGKGLSSATRNEGGKFDINFAEETRSDFGEGTISSCRIAIPTVDTILESVRVLRAIQKSQEQRGTSWSLHVASPDNSLQYLHILAESQEQNGIVESVESKDQNGSVSVGVVENEDRNGSVSVGVVENKDRNGSVSVGVVENKDRNGSVSVSVVDNKDRNGSLGVDIVENTNKNGPVINDSVERVKNTDPKESISNGTSTITIDGNKNGSTHILTQTNEKQNIASSYLTKEVKPKYVLDDLDQHNGFTNTQAIKDKQFDQDDEVPSFWPKRSVNQVQKKLVNGSVNASLTTESKEIKLLKTPNDAVEGTIVTNGGLLQTNVKNELCVTQNTDEISSNGYNIKENTSTSPSKNKLPQDNAASNTDSTENASLVNTNTSSNTDPKEVVEESTTEVLKIGQNLTDITQIYRISWDSIDSNTGNNSLNEDSFNYSTPEANCSDSSIKLKPPPQPETNEQPGTQEIEKSILPAITTLVEEKSSEQSQTLDKESARSPNTFLNLIDHLRPESVSDTSSSIYVSADCSPCASLYETDDNELGYSNQHFDELKQNVPYETKPLQVIDNGEPEETYSSSQDNEKSKDLKIQEQNTGDYSINDADSELQANKSESSLKDSGSNNDSSLTDQISEEKLSCPLIKTLEVETENVLATQQCDLEYSELSVLSALENSTKEQEIESLDFERTYNTSSNSITTVQLTNGNISENNERIHKNQVDFQTELDSEESTEIHGIKKFTTSSWNLEAIMESLYKLPDLSAPKTSKEETFQKEVYVLSEGAFCNYSEGNYTLLLQQQTLQLTQDSGSTDLLTLPLNYGEVSFIDRSTLKLDNKLGRCLFFKSEVQEELLELKEAIKKHCLLESESDAINLVHYPLKCHQNVVIVDLGSCSTRAGILMDEPTLPFLFFPSVCATDKQTGNQLFGNDALQSEVRQNSTLSFPIRPSIKIIKHDIEINLVGGLFRKIFQDLRVDPTQFTIQVCLPRSLSINAQNALVKFLLEDLKVKAVSLTHQALLTLYAHNVSTGIVVDIGDRMDILPVVDGFIVENGVTRLPYGGQRLIHHMKHALAEKHISLSNDIDAFVVQYITENLSYIAENYEEEIDITNKYPQVVKKTIALQTFAKDDNCIEHATLDDARFKVPEGLFKPELWGLDNKGIHKLVQKAIQGTGVDVRKKISENIYVSGGVTLIPGFVERLFKEVAILNAPRMIPKVIASNYRYHSTYIGACKFAKLDVFSNVCIDLEEYGKNQAMCLKKFVLCF